MNHTPTLRTCKPPSKDLVVSYILPWALKEEKDKGVLVEYPTGFGLTESFNNWLDEVNADVELFTIKFDHESEGGIRSLEYECIGFRKEEDAILFKLTYG